jgi:hypothetical protein
MSCNTRKYKLGISNILLGKDVKQEFCITTKADVSSSLNNKYFVVHKANDNAKHYFWFDVGGAGVDPAVPNSVGHTIAISANDSASAVATAVASALAGVATLIQSATASSNEVSVMLKDFGPAYVSRDALDPADRCGFKFALAKAGYVQIDLGPTDGEISITKEEEFTDITSAQTGSYVLDQLRKGMSVSASFSLKDTSKEMMLRIIGFDGTVYVTDDADSKVIGGYGTKNIFTSASDVATQLIFRPSYNAADAVADEDLTLLKAKLTLGEFVLSPEDELLLPVEAVGYLDESLYNGSNYLVYGDASKVGEA